MNKKEDGSVRNYLVLLFLISSVVAEERIHEYLIDISVQADGSMLVTETIDINNIRSEDKAIIIAHISNILLEFTGEKH